MASSNAICRIGVFYDGSFFAYAHRYYYRERDLGWLRFGAAPLRWTVSRLLSESSLHQSYTPSAVCRRRRQKLWAEFFLVNRRAKWTSFRRPTLTRVGRLFGGSSRYRISFDGWKKRSLPRQRQKLRGLFKSDRIGRLESGDRGFPLTVGRLVFGVSSLIGVS